MIYRFKKGITYHGVDAQIAGEELERIRVKNGGKLRPEDIVKSAKLRRSPIHEIFTWDDSAAAHAHRLAEARAFVRTVVIVVKQGPPLPAFWNVMVRKSVGGDQDAERYYQSAQVISRSPAEYDSALQVMLTELATAQDGLSKLELLAPKGNKVKVARASHFVASAQAALR